MGQASRSVASACAFALVCVVACIDRLPPPGEVMVEVATDMALPKDIDTVRVQILSNGQSYNDQSYAVGPDGLHIPATMGILAGSNAAATALVRVTAIHQGKAIVLREATTEVPSDHIALMRILLEFLCQGSAVDTPQAGTPADPTLDPITEATCPVGQTCKQGACVTSTVVLATLPTYAPAEVYGGGTGSEPSGTCFDTVSCFASAQTAALASSGCTVALPPGVSPDDVNVAIQTTDGQGICGGAAGQGPCFVPIDEDPAEGWQIQGNTVQLPTGLCAVLGSGSMASVALSGACPSKTPAIPTCGPWSSVSLPAITGAGYGEAGPDATGADVDAGSPTCVATGSMATARIGWGAGVTTLGGKVLVAGGLDSSSNTVLSSAEIYDPATGTFSAAGTMSSSRARLVLIALPNGSALALGGVNGSGTPLATADLYNPASGTWSPTGTMLSARADFGAILLADGRVLVVGGGNSGTAYDTTTGQLSGGTGSNTAEIYDPTSGLFSATGSMTVARNLAVGFGVSRLLDNDVLVVSDDEASAELYKPAGLDGGSDAGAFTSAGNLPSSVNDGIDFLTTLGTGHALVLNLLALSQNNSATAGGAALFDPTGVLFTSVAASPIGASSSAIQLTDGDVFLVGGENAGAPTAQTELYLTATGAWMTTANTTVVRHAPALANLPSGSVLVLGGCTTNGCGSSVLASAEICSP